MFRTQYSFVVEGGEHETVIFVKPEFLVGKFYIKRKEVATPGRKVEHLGAGDFAEGRCSRELVVTA